MRIRTCHLIAVVIFSFGGVACRGVGEQPTRTPPPTVMVQTSAAPMPATVAETAAIVTVTPPEKPTVTTTSTLDVTVSPTATATAVIPPSAIPTSPLATPVEPTPVSQPTAYAITGPLVIDSEGGRIYAPGRVGEDYQTLVLAASDGALLATYPVVGQLALDATHGWLYVDQGDAGVTVLDANTGAWQASTRDLPEPPPGIRPAPQADIANMQGLVFRDNMIYVLDGMTGATIRALTTDVKLMNSGALPIEGMVFDNDARILYLAYSYSPYYPHQAAAVVALDLDSGSEIARQVGACTLGQSPAAAGSLYSTAEGVWFHYYGGSGSVCAWRQGQPWFVSRSWTNDLLPGLQLDTQRGRLYGATETELLVFDAPTMALLLVAARPAGQLAGYDPKTNQLYFVTSLGWRTQRLADGSEISVEEGQLSLWPVSAISPRPPQPLVAATPASLPVRAIAVAPGGEDTEQPLVAGIWQHSDNFEDTMILGRSAGDLYLGQADGDHMAWRGPAAGPRTKSPQFTAVALSPAYARDKTIFAGIQGMGVFRSMDGGQSWQPASSGLASMQVDSFLISNGFGDDHTVFVDGMRSRDAGRTWQALSIKPCQLAMSPEFANDRTMAASTGETCKQLQVSQDGGDIWQETGQLPGEGRITMLSLAPLYAKWHVVFAATQPSLEHPETGAILYRSADGGASWQAVLQMPVEMLSGWPYPVDMELVYAPEDEAHRSVYLLVMPAYDPGWNTATGYNPSAPPTEPGRLYMSSDGGQTWQQASLPASIAPTALAISPNFTQDQLLYLGTKDGRIVPIAAGSLAGQP